MASADMLDWDSNFSGAVTLAAFYKGVLLFWYCAQVKQPFCTYVNFNTHNRTLDITI